MRRFVAGLGLLSMLACSGEPVEIQKAPKFFVTAAPSELNLPEQAVDPPDPIKGQREWLYRQVKGIWDMKEEDLMLGEQKNFATSYTDLVKDLTNSFVAPLLDLKGYFRSFTFDTVGSEDDREYLVEESYQLAILYEDKSFEQYKSDLADFACERALAHVPVNNFNMFWTYKNILEETYPEKVQPCIEDAVELSKKTFLDIAKEGKIKFEYQLGFLETANQEYDIPVEFAILEKDASILLYEKWQSPRWRFKLSDNEFRNALQILKFYGDVNDKDISADLEELTTLSSNSMYEVAATYIPFGNFEKYYGFLDELESVTGKTTTPIKSRIAQLVVQNLAAEFQENNPDTQHVFKTIEESWKYIKPYLKDNDVFAWISEEMFNSWREDPTNHKSFDRPLLMANVIEMNDPSYLEQYYETLIERFEPTPPHAAHAINIEKKIFAAREIADRLGRDFNNDRREIIQNTYDYIFADIQERHLKSYHRYSDPLDMIANGPSLEEEDTEDTIIVKAKPLQPINLREYEDQIYPLIVDMALVELRGPCKRLESPWESTFPALKLYSDRNGENPHVKKVMDALYEKCQWN
ncbi:hypothetical protein GOV11_02940 [Candidatus Woesearchaeota archaeon]|nr:hypothetical protein [Candidatus Woesearchaeota archaeon]